MKNALSLALTLLAAAVAVHAAHAALQEPRSAPAGAPVPAAPSEQPVPHWELSPWAGEPPSLQNLWSSVVRLEGAPRAALVVPATMAFVLRHAWSADPEESARLELRVRAPGEPAAGFLVKTLGAGEDWRTPGFRINAGETLVLSSRAPGSCGYTGYFIDE